jgi:hypothetical protein
MCISGIVAADLLAHELGALAGGTEPTACAIVINGAVAPQLRATCKWVPLRQAFGKPRTSPTTRSLRTSCARPRARRRQTAGSPARATASDDGRVSRPRSSQLTPGRRKRKSGEGPSRPPLWTMLGERDLDRRRHLLRLAKERRCRSTRRYPFHARRSRRWRDYLRRRGAVRADQCARARRASAEAKASTAPTCAWSRGCRNVERRDLNVGDGESQSIAIDGAVPFQPRSSPDSR